MHRIDRDTVPVPACLAVQPAVEKYDRLNTTAKAEIRAALLTLQGNRCAYCERRTGDESDDGHIEHFRKQADNPALNLTWSNMYWSCSHEKTCGKHKDKCVRESHPRLAKFDPKEIIDPGTEDPRPFFLFATDGHVFPYPGLNAHGLRRASETLRIFQLEESAQLRWSREDAVKPYIRNIAWILDESPEKLELYVRTQLEQIGAEPFVTPIRQYLEGFLL